MNHVLNKEAQPANGVMNRIHKAVIYIYGLILIIETFFTIVTEIAPTGEGDSLHPFISWAEYIFSITGTNFICFPFGAVVGYGLLRRRWWSRYGVIAAMLTLPIRYLVVYLASMSHVLTPERIIINVFFILLTLMYFSLPSLKLYIGTSPSIKLKSWPGLLVTVIVIGPLLPFLITVGLRLYFSITSNTPFRPNQLQALTLNRPSNSALNDYFQPVRLLDTSFIIPRDFAIRRLTQRNAESHEWKVSLSDRSAWNRGFIMFGNANPFEETPFDQRLVRTELGLKSNFDYEKYLFTDSWSPGTMIIQSLIKPVGGAYSIREIHINGMKGFLRRWEKWDNVVSEFSLYNEDETRFIGGTFILKKRYFSDNDILFMLSSIAFLKPEDPRLAETHFELGIQRYNAGDIIESQYEFANAYYLMPQNAKFIYRFARTLPETGPNAIGNIKELLDRALLIDHNNVEARRWLISVERQLSAGKEGPEAKAGGGSSAAIK